MKKRRVARRSAAGGSGGGDRGAVPAEATPPGELRLARTLAVMAVATASKIMADAGRGLVASCLRSEAERLSDQWGMTPADFEKGSRVMDRALELDGWERI